VIRQWPRLPKVVQGIGGPIRVLRPVRLVDDDWGGWSPEERVIRIRATLSREVAWHTLLHELTHAMVDDSSLPIPEALVETLCDLNAGAMSHPVYAALVAATKPTTPASSAG
jgi:hypothetical protein